MGTKRSSVWRRKDFKGRVQYKLSSYDVIIVVVGIIFNDVTGA